MTAAEVEARLVEVEQEWRACCERERANFEEVKELRRQVDNWERLEIKRASCCVDNEKWAKKAEAQAATMRAALEHCRHRPHEHNPPADFTITRCEVIDRALASDAGEGWLSPDQARALVDRVVEACAALCVAWTLERGNNTLCSGRDNSLGVSAATELAEDIRALDRAALLSEAAKTPEKPETSSAREKPEGTR